MPTVTVDLQEGFEDDVVEILLGGEHRWREEAVTTNDVVSLAASVPLEVEAGEHELLVSVPSRGVEAALHVDAAKDVPVAANLEHGRLRLEQLGEPPYYL